MGHQGLRDRSAVAGKPVKLVGAVQQVVTIPSLESFEIYKEKGVWEVGGGRGEGCGDILYKTVVMAAAAELITVQNRDRHKRPDCQQEIQSARACSLSKAPIQDLSVCTSILRDCASYTGSRGRSGQSIEGSKKVDIPITGCFSWGGRVGKVTPMPVFFGI